MWHLKIVESDPGSCTVVSNMPTLITTREGACLQEKCVGMLYEITGSVLEK